MGDVPQSHGNRATHAENQAEAFRLKLRGLSDREAGKILGVSHTTIQNWTKSEAEDRVLPLADELRKVQLERLGEMRQAALTVLERFHVVVSHGKVVEHDGEPIEDDGPVLAAIDRLLRIEERIAKLCGLDAPLESSISGSIETRTPEIVAMIATARAEQVAAEVRLVAEGEL